jgi:hypothetical protein
MFHGKMQDPLCDELAYEMSEAGIKKSLLTISDFTYAFKDCPLTIEESFLRHRDVLARHPGRFDVFGGIDPRWGKDGTALFEGSVMEFGFRGLCVYPLCGFSASSPELYPYYELCAHHKLPVLLHLGPTSPILDFSAANPLLLDEAARRFPSVNFILAQAAGSFFHDCIMMCRFRPNIYLEISGYQGSLNWDPECSSVKNTVSQGINHKVLFGTDWPMFRLQGDQREFTQVITSEAGPLSTLHQTERKLILWDNAERLLRPCRLRSTVIDGAIRVFADRNPMIQ